MPNADLPALLGTLMRERRSIRGFKPEAIIDDDLQAILADAQHAPSWCNIQPWRVALTRPPFTQRVTAALLQAATTTMPTPEIPFLVEYPPPYRENRRACGGALYAAMGIPRDDKWASRCMAAQLCVFRCAASTRGLGRTSARHLCVCRRRSVVGLSALRSASPRCRNVPHGPIATYLSRAATAIGYPCEPNHSVRDRHGLRRSDRAGQPVSDQPRRDLAKCSVVPFWKRTIISSFNVLHKPREP